MIMLVVSAAVMSDPPIVRVNVRRVGMPFLIAVIAPRHGRLLRAVLRLPVVGPAILRGRARRRRVLFVSSSD